MLIKGVGTRAIVEHFRFVLCARALAFPLKRRKLSNLNKYACMYIYIVRVFI